MSTLMAYKFTMVQPRSNHYRTLIGSYSLSVKCNHVFCSNDWNCPKLPSTQMLHPYAGSATMVPTEAVLS